MVKKGIPSIKQPPRDPAPGVHADTGPEHADHERRHHADGSAEPPADGTSHAGSKECEDLGHSLPR